MTQSRDRKVVQSSAALLVVAAMTWMPAAAAQDETGLPGRETADQYLAEAQAKESEQDIRLTVSLFEAWVGEQAAGAESAEEEEAYRRLFIDANAALISQGPTDTHVQVGIQRQILYLRRQETLPLEPAIGPVFDLLEMGGASPAVYNSAGRSLEMSPSAIAEHDQDYFIERTLELLWNADTPELAELPLAVLTALMRESGYVTPVLDQIDDQIDPHRNDWAVNPATALAAFSGTLPGLDHRPERETAGAIMGKAIASPALDMDYLGPHLARGGGILATLDHNTVEGVIAVFSPMIFAEEKPAHYSFDMESFMEPMLGRPAWLQRDPGALETWTGFLERVAALDDPDFSPVAVQALTGFE